MKPTYLLTICLGLLLIGGVVQADFVDNFDRADGDIGNDWVITSAGNGGTGGGTAPTGAIVSGEVVMSRSGWGPDANYQMVHSTDGYVNSISVDLDISSFIGGGTSQTLQLWGYNTNTGAFILTQVQNYSSTGLFRLQVASSTDGSWQDWTYYCPLDDAGDNPGELKIEITTDVSGNYTVTALTTADDSVYTTYSNTNSGFVGEDGFDSLTVKGIWTGWTGQPDLAVDNVVATNVVPEPATMVLLAAGGLAGLIRCKK